MKTCVVSILLIILSLAGLSAAAVVSDDSIMDAIRLPSDSTGLDDLFTEIMRVAQDAGETTKKPRPWDCCDRSICTALIPPKCRCLDKVDQCSNACNKCEETEDSSRYTCADVYNDVPGPVCTQGHETRPWKCCNKQICTKSFPPICTCKDLFDKPCEEACKRCMVLGGPHKRYQCLDSYFGHMAPRCGLHGGMQ